MLMSGRSRSVRFGKPLQQARPRNSPSARARNACCRVRPRFNLLEMADPPFEINLAEVSTLDERQEFVSMVGVQAMVRATCLQVIWFVIGCQEVARKRATRVRLPRHATTLSYLTRRTSR